MPKRTKIKIIIYIVLFVLAVVALIWWTTFNSARARDYTRLGHMRILEAEMNRYFFKFNTYNVPECSDGFVVNFCGGAGDKTLNVNNIVDPINSGNFRYIISEMTETDFKVDFYLERGLFGLPNGKYTLTREGLGR